MPKVFYAYMLRCCDGSYYVGQTDDLERRIAEHAAGTIRGYTSRRRPVALVWAAGFVTREEAVAAEAQVKGWRRAKKEVLIAEEEHRLPALAARYGRALRQTDRASEDGPDVGASVSE